MPSRRCANWLGFSACLLALGVALYGQYVLGLEPCHLCIFQRVTVAALGAAFLLAALVSRGRLRGAIAAGLIAIAGLATLATSGRHMWIQMQPAGAVPGCGADLDFMLEVFPLIDVVLKVFRAGGECAQVDFTLLGLSTPVWVFGFALAVTAGGVWLNLRAGD